MRCGKATQRGERDIEWVVLGRHFGELDGDKEGRGRVTYSEMWKGITVGRRAASTVGCDKANERGEGEVRVWTVGECHCGVWDGDTQRRGRVTYTGMWEGAIVGCGKTTQRNKISQNLKRWRHVLGGARRTRGVANAGLDGRFGVSCRMGRMPV